MSAATVATVANGLSDHPQTFVQDIVVGWPLWSDGNDVGTRWDGDVLWFKAKWDDTLRPWSGGEVCLWAPWWPGVTACLACSKLWWWDERALNSTCIHLHHHPVIHHPINGWTQSGPLVSAPRTLTPRGCPLWISRWFWFDPAASLNRTHAGFHVNTGATPTDRRHI